MTEKSKDSSEPAPRTETAPEPARDQTPDLDKEKRAERRSRMALLGLSVARTLLAIIRFWRDS